MKKIQQGTPLWGAQQLCVWPGSTAIKILVTTEQRPQNKQDNRTKKQYRTHRSDSQLWLRMLHRFPIIAVDCFIHH
jgi:hypothetical protein